MAVEPQQVLMVEGNLNGSAVLVTEAQANEEETEEVSADILQQALQEASEGFDQASVEYENVESAVAVVHGATSGQVGSAEDFEVGVETDDTNNSEGISLAAYPNGTVTTATNIATGAVRVLTSESQAPAIATVEAPIGSSQNPIQIIQQGNTYHSTQVLTQEQLQQIAQVLQQQQQLSQITSAGGTSVLYNAATNTRIVYRIIYPSELHSKGNSAAAASQTTDIGTAGRGGSGRGRGRPRKPWGRRFEEEEEKTEIPELSREEREEKKKHRPRTRSGRISKPPKYMVKDYKRIHHLDFDVDPYDDSDGGYSDFQFSEEDHDDNSLSSSSTLPTGISTSKSRKYRCSICDKAYIGKGGLARHFRMHPTHGSAEELEAEINASIAISDSGPATPVSVSSNQASNDATPTTSASESSNTVVPIVTSISAMLSSSSKTTTATTTTTTPQVVLPSSSAGRGRGRGRPPNPILASAKRKAKLEELVQQCDNEELMEIVLSRLAKVVSVWEFLLMKCEKGSPARPDISDICKELDNLLKQTHKMAENYLAPVSEAQLQTDGTYIQISSEQLANALGISIGVYEIKEINPEEDTTFQYKMLTSNPQKSLSHSSRRTIEVVRAEDIIAEPANKKRRLNLNVNENATDLALSSNLEDGLGERLTEPILEEEQDLQHGQDESLDLEGLNEALESQAEESNGKEGNVNCTELQDINFQAQCPENNNFSEKHLSSLSLRTSEIAGKNNGALSDASLEVQQSEQNSNFISVGNSTLVQDSKKTSSVAEQSEPQSSDDSVNVNNSSEVETTLELQSVHLVSDEKIIQKEENEHEINLIDNGESQYITHDGQLITTLQDSNGEAILGQVICQSSEEGEVIRQVMIQDGQIIGSGQFESVTDLSELQAQGLLPSNMLIVQNADGSTTTLQLPSDQNIPLETVQALLAMDAETQAQFLRANTIQQDETQ